MRKFGKGTTQIRVKVGDSFVLELPAAATGGYTWQLTHVPSVAVLSVERLRAAEPGAGASSIQEFEFVATRAGADILSMEYKRSWEAAAGEQLEVSIVVEL